MNSPRLRILAALALASALSSLVHAQPTARTFTSSFVFGDSLSDTGNLFAATGGANPPPPYFAGRFSNGPLYSELLIPGLQNIVTAAGTVKTNLNFAFAGATAVGATPVPASLPVQLGLFQGRGITPGANDLFVVLAGANDVLNAIANPATQNDPGVTAAARAAASSVTSTVQTLASSGARNFLVINLPNLAQTARFTTGSGVPAASLATSGSLAFNAAIRTNLAGASLSGANVTVVDLQAFLNIIVRNPAAFGFTDTTHSIVDILTAGGNPGDQNGFVFFDSIHPTTKTHAILVGALREILNPEFVLGTAGVQGTSILAAADMTADTVDARLDQVRHGGNHHNADGFISYNYKNGGRRFNSFQPGFNFGARVLTAGFDYQLTPDMIVGLAFSTESLNAKLSTVLGRGSFKLTGETGTAYAQWKSGATIAEGTVSYGGQDIRDISRPTSLASFTTSGKTTGSRYGASVKLGHDFSDTNAKVHFIPFVGLRYGHGTLSRYDESDVPGLNFAFGEQNVKAMGAQIGANYDYPLNFGEVHVMLNLSAVYSLDLLAGTRTLAGRLADNMSQTTKVQVDEGNGSNLKLDAHITGGMGKRWSWTLGFGGETRNDGKDAIQYSAALQTGF